MFLVVWEFVRPQALALLTLDVGMVMSMEVASRPKARW